MPFWSKNPIPLECRIFFWRKNCPLKYVVRKPVKEKLLKCAEHWNFDICSSLDSQLNFRS